MNYETALILVHAASTWFMTGLIWFVQVVHYPLFESVGQTDFAKYESRHQRLTTFVVAPVMLTELLTATALCVVPGAAPPTLAFSGFGLLVVVWASTWLVQVPIHKRLETGHDAKMIRRLALLNWPRTAAWTARGFLAGWMFSSVMG